MNHPRFGHSKLVSTGSTKVLETELQTEERAYEQWRSSITAHNIDPKKYRFLLLPLRDSNLDKCGACTNRRNVTVTPSPYRSPTTTIHSYSPTPSTSSERNSPPSQSQNCGTYFMPSAQPKKRSQPSMATSPDWETSGQRTSFSPKKAKLNWPMSIHGQENSMASPSSWKDNLPT